jgi:hypothetical protein
MPFFGFFLFLQNFTSNLGVLMQTNGIFFVATWQAAAALLH